MSVKAIPERCTAVTPHLIVKKNGAEAIEAPVLRISPPADSGPLERAAAGVRSFDWVVFTSTNAVAALVGQVLTDAQDLRALAGPRLCAVGPGTASRLSTRMPGPAGPSAALRTSAPRRA